MIAFIIGPYNANDLVELDRNIARASAAALTLWQNGVPCICPHTNTFHFNDNQQVPESVYYQGYQEILRRCDVVLVLSGWTNSVGSSIEYSLAMSLNKRVYYDVNALISAAKEQASHGEKLRKISAG